MIREFKECAQKEAVDNQQLFELAADCESSGSKAKLLNGRTADVNKAFIGGVSQSLDN